MNKSVLLAAAAALALALPASPVHAQAAQPKVLKKVPPDFPAEAARKGIDKGVLKARLTVNEAGNVTEVSIVDTQPTKAKLLNESVITALNQWKFESGKASTFEMQIVLTYD